MNPLEITALPAADKRAIVDALNAARIPLILGAAPTTATEGRKGQFAIWVESGELVPRYAMCVKAEAGVYTWRMQDGVLTQEAEPTEALFPGLLWIKPSSSEINLRNAANSGWIVTTLGEPGTGALRFDLEQGLDPADAAQGRDNIQFSEVGLRREIVVHDAAARLALSLSDATLTAVTQEDTGVTWTLKQTSINPATADDWVVTARPASIDSIILHPSTSAVIFRLPTRASVKFPLQIRNLAAATKTVESAVSDGFQEVAYLAQYAIGIFHPADTYWRYSLLPVAPGIAATYDQAYGMSMTSEFSTARNAGQLGGSSLSDVVTNLAIGAPTTFVWDAAKPAYRNPAGNTGHQITLPEPAVGQIGPYLLYAEEGIDVVGPRNAPPTQPSPGPPPGALSDIQHTVASGYLAVFTYDLVNVTWNIKEFKIKTDPHRSVLYEAAPSTGTNIELNRRIGGDRQKIALTGATQARMFKPPVDPVEGQELTVRLVNTVGANPSPRTLEFDPLIIRPSLSITTWPHPLVNDKAYIAKLQYVDDRWELLAFTGAY